MCLFRETLARVKSTVSMRNSLLSVHDSIISLGKHNDASPLQPNYNAPTTTAASFEVLQVR